MNESNMLGADVDTMQRDQDREREKEKSQTLLQNANTLLVFSTLQPFS